jgi:hypothetical protein
MKILGSFDQKDTAPMTSSRQRRYRPDDIFASTKIPQTLPSGFARRKNRTVPAALKGVATKNVLGAFFALGFFFFVALEFGKFFFGYLVILPRSEHFLATLGVTR